MIVFCLSMCDAERLRVCGLSFSGLDGSTQMNEPPCRSLNRSICRRAQYLRTAFCNEMIAKMEPSDEPPLPLAPASVTAGSPLEPASSSLISAARRGLRSVCKLTRR